MDHGEDLSRQDPQTAAERGREISDHRTGGSGHGYSKGRSYGTAAGLIAGDRTASQLVVGVGYPYLSDLAVGNVIADRVAEWDLPEVAVADCSHTPIAAYQTITKGEYENIVIVGARKRGDGLNTGTPSNDPGAIHTYPTESIDVPENDIVNRIAECAMGSNTIENVVIITKALGEFPSGSVVIDIEPEYDSWGYAIEEFSPAVSDRFDRLVNLVLDELETSYRSSD